MARKALIILLSAFTCILTACKFNPNLQGTGNPQIQGTWVEDSVAFSDQMLQFTKHKLKFTCDSVYITMQTFAQVNRYPGNCFNDGSWTEYAKGTYLTKEDTLIVNSTFTKADFKQKISGCYRIGQYLPAYIIRKNTADSLVLESLQQHSLIRMSLTEKSVCIQKPLN